MKQAGGEPQARPREQQMTVARQHLASSSDPEDEWRRLGWVVSVRDSLELLREKQLQEREFLARGQRGGESPAVGLCKFVFYVFFYLGVAALFMLCMEAFYSTLSLTEPKHKLDQSLVGSSPGLGFRPVTDEQRALITYRLGDIHAIRDLTKELDLFLEPYSDAAQETDHYYDCDFGNFAPTHKVCKVNISQWRRCTSREGYGYGTGSPCVFIKLNRIYAWEPKFYNRTSDLPEEMPEDLRTHIQSVGDEKRRNVVWVSCGGFDTRDARNMGSLSYVPARGFPGYFYPYRNQRGYLSPLVAVRFNRPKRGVTIKVECKAWARNIVHSREEVLGMGYFQLRVE
ncbi:sodium/potassium-transporting ATPase subunit beta-2-like [Schistocerca americana]|uniref:sodium/potassium-transporting ATPase subunit beta-2-like n=1 Tax=Schistocerca americana TaxID=7009 RepID=UPI001F4FBDC9|nr:sodium/potassium-transporting ATPase subunit beta-2-like [Schistocerca americana]